MSLEPYKVTMEKRDFGNYQVEVLHDLAWACINVNGTWYETPGNNDGFWLESHDNKGSMSRPLEWLLQMIRMNRDPDKLTSDERSGLDSWLRHGEGGALVAAWREALARAKAFWESPVSLSEACVDEVVNRWQREQSATKKVVLGTFIPEGRRASLGMEAPTPLRTKGGDLQVPF